MTDNDLSQCSSWFVADAEGAQSGPFTLEQLKSSKAYFDRNQTRVWCEYLPEWTPVNDVSFLVKAFTTLQVEDEQEPDICELISSKSAPDDRMPRVKFNEYVEVHALDSFRSDSPSLTSETPKSSNIDPSAAAPIGISRVQAALKTMNASLINIGSSKRRPLLLFPIIDLGRYIEDLERTAFASLTEEAILAQLCLEVTKERDNFSVLSEEQQRSFHDRSLAFTQAQNADMVAATDELERDSMAIVDTAYQILQAESSNSSEYSDMIEARAHLDSTISSNRIEIQYLRRLAERQLHLTKHTALYVYYRTIVTAIMQYLLAMRLLQGLNGPDHDRYKKKIKADPVLKSLVKKGIEVQGQICPLARGDAATIMTTVLDALLNIIHSSHVAIRSYYHHSTENVRFATAVQTCADTIAQTLTLRYEEQIRMLTCRSAQTLAEFGLRAMFHLLSKGIPFPEDNRNITLMVSHVVASVQDESTLNKGSKIFAKKEKLLTIRGLEKDTWNAVGIYRKSGVRVYTEKGDSQRFFEGGLFEANPRKYGYRLGSLSECETLKMTETTPSRHRTDMATACYDSSDRPTMNAFVLSESTRGSPGMPSPASMNSSNMDVASTIDDKIFDDDPKSTGDLETRIHHLEGAVELLTKENLALKQELERIRQCLQQSGFQL